MSNSHAEKMFDAGVRVEQMYWIAGICASTPSEFHEFLEDDLPCCLDILQQLPWLIPLVNEGADSETIMAEFAARNIDGFFVQLMTPKPRDFFEGGYSSSWGICRTGWFFCETLDDVVNTAIVWQRSVVETLRAKSDAPALAHSE